MASTSLSPKMTILCWPRTLGLGDYKRQPLVWRFSCQKYHGPQLCGRARYYMMYTSFRVRYPLVLSKPKRSSHTTSILDLSLSKPSRILPTTGPAQAHHISDWNFAETPYLTTSSPQLRLPAAPLYHRTNCTLSALL